MDIFLIAGVVVVVVVIVIAVTIVILLDTIGILLDGQISLFLIAISIQLQSASRRHGIQCILL